MSADISDCVAMDEAGEWVAYPDTLGRSGSMAAAARSQWEIGYGNWQETFEHFRVRRGYLRPDADRGDGWWLITVADDPQSVPVWIVATKRWWHDTDPTIPHPPLARLCGESEENA